MRIGLGLATVALLLASACGGESDSGPAASKTSESASPTLELLTADQACAQVQMVVDDLGGEPGRWTIDQYGTFSENAGTLAAEADPTIGDALESTSEQAARVASMDMESDDVATASGVWASTYQDVVDICARTDSPVTRLG